MEPEKYDDIEWVEAYRETTSSNNLIRRETSYPYEWDSRNDNSHRRKMKGWSPGRYKIIIRVKKKCHDRWYEEECWVHFDDHGGGGHTGNCDWKWRNKNDLCEKHYRHNDHWYFKMEPEKYSDIEWVEAYRGTTSSSNLIRRETSYPYEWDSRNDNSHRRKMKGWSPGRHKVIIRVKKKCHDRWYEEECWVHFDSHSGGGNNNGNNCNSDASFSLPRSNSRYRQGHDLYVRVNANRHQDIEWMKLYINGKFIRQESNSPYEWNGKGSNGDAYLKSMKKGNYTLKCEYRTKCGRTYNITRNFSVF